MRHLVSLNCLPAPIAKKIYIFFLVVIFLSILLLICNGVKAQPVISSLSTSSGIPGSSVTITGTNFNSTAANDIVYFGATRAMVNTASATSLSVTVPVGATYAPVTVNNTATGLVGYSERSFLPDYNNSAYIPGTVNLDHHIEFTDGPDSVRGLATVIKDIDGDGKPDIIVLNQHGFSVYRNISTSGSITSSSFAAPVKVAVTAIPIHFYVQRQLAADDIDGDGKADIAICNGSDTIFVIRNTSVSGSVSFASPVAYTGSYLYGSIAIADIDKDGKADIIGGGDAGISVWRNLATIGTIDASSLSTSIDFDGLGYGSNSGIAIADFDGDGKPDVAGDGCTTLITVYQNISTAGTVNFAAPINITTGLGSTDMVACDIDGDGKPDLAMINAFDYTISVLHNTATAGTIDGSTFGTQIALPSGLYISGIASGDINGDGKPDLVVTNSTVSSVSVYRNTVTPGTFDTNSFAQPVIFAMDFAFPVSIAVGDLDGDGKPDIFTANGGIFSGNSISVLRNDPLLPPPTITSVSPLIDLPGASVTITGTGFNATAANDIVYFGATRATVNTASATSLNVTVPVGATYMPVTVNNAATNLVGYSEYAFLPTYDNSGHIKNLANFDQHVDLPTGNTPGIPVICDLDGDGKPDILIPNTGDGTISVYHNISSSGLIAVGSFAAPVIYATGSQPWFLATGDIDGDGKPDVAIVNYGDGTVSVLHNTSTSGSISLSSQVTFATGTQPTSIVIGDVDGDGKPDLCIANSYDGSVSVLRNTSFTGTITAGSFAGQVVFTIADYYYLSSIAIGDLDGDGKPDLAVTTYGNSVFVYRNTSFPGSVSFADTVSFITGNVGYGKVVISDIDGDGKADIITGNQIDTTVSVLRNTSALGSVSFATQVTFATDIDPYGIAMGDMNGDGKPDIVTANLDNLTLSVLLNISSSGVVSFTPQQLFTTGSVTTLSNPQAIAIGDVDGDGRPDLVATGSQDNLVFILRNDPELAPPTITSVTPNKGNTGSSVTITGTNFNPTPTNNIVYFGATRATVTGGSTSSLNVTVPVGATYMPISVNNDSGYAAYAQYPFLPTYDNTPYIPGTINFDPQVVFGADGPNGVAIGDLDGDGKADMAVINKYNNTVLVYLNTSSGGSITTGSFAAPISFSTGVGPLGITISDMNGDGKPDIAVSNDDNTLTILHNTSSTGTLSFTSSQIATGDAYGFFGQTPSGNSGIAMGDIDGDGKPDMAIANFYQRTVFILRNLSSGDSIGFADPIFIGDYISTSTSIAIVDIDGDGKRDVVVPGLVFRNIASVGTIKTSSFAAPVTFATGSVDNGNLAIGDIDGDGKPDIAVVNEDDNTISVLRNTSASGSVSFATQVTFVTGGRPWNLAMGDIDGDGKPDIAVTNNGDNTVSVFRNTSATGSVSFSTQLVLASGYFPKGIAIGDIDGDGKPDIVATNEYDATISILRNDPLYPPPTITSVSPIIDSPGSSITITGTNFNTTPANDIVYFGATRATVNTASATSLSVTVPVGATYAPVTVDNTLHGLTAFSPKAFLPDYNNSGYAAGVVNFDPHSDFDNVINFLLFQTVVITDIDGDGKADLVVLNNHGFSVYRNMSTSGSLTGGSFAAPTDFAVIGMDPSGVVGPQIATGDIDGDGKPDVAICNASNTIFVFRNTSTSGSVSFSSSVSFLGNTSEVYGSVAIMDVDGDGKADIIGGGGNFGISVLRNTATVGTIDATSFADDIDFPGNGAYSGMSVSDLDGDGKPDVAGTNGGNSVAVYQNTSSPGIVSFATAVNFNTGSNSENVVICDIDGDGKPDMAVVNKPDNTFSLLHNTISTGTIDGSSFATQVVFATGGTPGNITCGDLDGDGKPDLLVTNADDNTVSLYRNVAIPGTINSSSLTGKGTLTTGLAPGGIAVGDLDGDSRPDIVVVDLYDTAYIGYGSISVMRNDPLYPPPTITSLNHVIDSPGTSITITGTGFNTTAANDIVFFGATRATVNTASATSLNVTVPTGATYGPVTVNTTTHGLTAFSAQAFLQDYNNSAYIPGTVNFDPKVIFSAGNTPDMVAIGDLDGDGKADMVVTNQNDFTVSIYLNTSLSGSITTGSFAAPIIMATGNYPMGLAIGDINGDGKPDVVVSCNDNTITVLGNTSSVGALSFSSSSTFLGNATSYVGNSGNWGIAIGDLDGDGRADLAIANNYQNAVFLVRNISSGGSIAFDNPVFITGSINTSVAIGDLDGDGRPEIIACTNGAASVLVFHNINTGALSKSSFDAPLTFATGNAPNDVVIGDIDGDGKLDLAIPNTNDNTISILRNTSTSGSVSFAAQVTFVTGNQPFFIAIGDIDGDGKPDMASGNAGDTTINVFRNTSTSGSVSFASPVIAGIGAAPTSIAMCDIDGDGKPDIIATNQGDNTVSVLRNDPLSSSGILGNTSICIGSTSTLSDAITGGTWNSSNTSVATVGSTGIVTGVSAGTTLISYTTSGGTATTTVTVNPTPVVSTFPGAAGYCYPGGTPATTSASGSGGAYLWSPGGATTSTLSVTPSSTTVYTVTGTSPAGCSAIATFTVNVSSTPTINVSPSSVVRCFTDPGNTITVSGISTSYTWSPAAGLSASTGSSVVTTATTTTTYTVTGSTGACSASNTVAVSVNPIPGISGIYGVDPVTGNTNAVCYNGSAGQTMDYYYTAGSPAPDQISVTWSPAGGPANTGTYFAASSPFYVNIPAGGTAANYTGTINMLISSTGCTNRATTTLTINALPVPTFIATPGPNTCTATNVTYTTQSGQPFYVWNLPGTCGVDYTLVSPAGGCGTDLSITNTVTIQWLTTGAHTVTVNYYNSSSCTGVAPAAYTTTVVASPTAAPTNTGPICAAGTATLNANPAGATHYLWSGPDLSSPTAQNPTATPTVTSTYSLTVSNTSCSPATVYTTTIIVNSSPNAGNITGTTIVCSGATTSLTDAAGGGVWSSGAGNANVGSTGIVTGVSAGTATISYTVTNSCGSASATAVVTVNPLPNAGSITGTTAVCTGSTTNLTDAVSGGVWSSGATGIATVGSTGIVTGVAAGTAKISYTVTNSCGSANTTTIVTVNAATSAGTITGPSSVNAGSNITLTDAVSGGVWSASNGNATVSGGVVTGVTAGTVIISYAVTGSCGTAYATMVITVNTSSLPGITGIASVCVGATTSLTDATTGGTWSSSNVSIATVGTGGIVTGIAVGTANITYTQGGSHATITVTVNSSPLPIHGASSECVGITISLSDATAGGTWSSSNANATIDPSGNITGVTAGTSTTTYMLADGCYATYPNTILPNPVAITGTGLVCVGGTTMLTDATSGSLSWTSSNTSVATAINSGQVTGVAVGTAIITYKVTSGCFATTTVTVTSTPGAISGNSAICVGSSIILSDASGAGTWTSSNTTIATVGSASGIVTGVAGGTATVTYMPGTGGCKATAVVTVNAAAAITGNTNICAGTTTTLSDASAGGTWISGNTGIATIGLSSGVVTGVSTGSVAITYTLVSGCTRTAIVTVTGSMSPVSGPGTVCAGSATTFSDATTGGAWSLSSSLVASINSSTGVVTASGTYTGTTTISYAAGGCVATQVLTVSPNPTPIQGLSSECAGVTITLTDATPGGIWSGTGDVVAAGSGTAGTITGGAVAGTGTITYTIATGCLVTYPNTVYANPAPITGTFVVCTGTTTNLTDATGGGVSWTSSNTAVATNVGSTITGVAAGTATIIYKVLPGNCIATQTVTVNASPVVSAISGPSSISYATPATLSDATAGGIWSSNHVAVISLSGSTGSPITATAMTTYGTAIISYAVTNGASCTTTVTKTVTAAAAPPPHGGTTGTELTAVDKEILLYPNPTNGTINIRTDVAGIFCLYTLDGRALGSYKVVEGITNMALPNELATGIYMGKYVGDDGSTKLFKIMKE